MYVCTYVCMYVCMTYGGGMHVRCEGMYLVPILDELAELLLGVLAAQGLLQDLKTYTQS
jgi:hypothetical protein